MCNIKDAKRTVLEIRRWFLETLPVCDTAACYDVISLQFVAEPVYCNLSSGNYVLVFHAKNHVMIIANAVD